MDSSLQKRVYADEKASQKRGPKLCGWTTSPSKVSWAAENLSSQIH